MVLVRPVVPPVAAGGAARVRRASDLLSLDRAALFPVPELRPDAVFLSVVLMVLLDEVPRSIHTETGAEA